MNTNLEEYHAAAGEITEAVESQLFGKPCYKINGKAFCCFFQDEMVFKLTSDAHAAAYSLDGSKLFDPSGKNRPMKEWVQVPIDYLDQWNEFTTAAAKYVGGKSK
ncbi:MAG: hypothetical protein GQ574_19560 [Crocinitomix sp.]|nr:hypothetical protein [Crocinitomix sp.]